jgi:hypothetical protein
VPRLRRNRVFAYDRGGERRIEEITSLISVKWSRVRDDRSACTIIIADARQQAKLLGMLSTGRHEIVVFREGERVWEGPITNIVYVGDGMEFTCTDITWYLYKTTMRAAYSSAHPRVETVIARMERIIRAELARKEAIAPGINVLEHLTTFNHSTDARTAMVTPPYKLNVWEHLDNAAAKQGIDYTTIGRRLMIWDTSRSIGQTRTLTRSDFQGNPRLTEYGAELTTIAQSTDGEGVYGQAGAVDPFYGEIETLFTAYDEESDEERPSQAELQSQAVRNLKSRNPAPVMLRIPDNTQLVLNETLRMEHLVPGTYMPLRLAHPARTFTQMQKLSTVVVEESGEGEKISVTLSPASASDEAEAEA